MQSIIYKLNNIYINTKYKNYRNVKCHNNIGRNFNNRKNKFIIEKIKQFNRLYYSNEIYSLELYDIIEDTFKYPCKVSLEVKYNKVFLNIYPTISTKKTVLYLQYLETICKLINSWGLEYYIKKTFNNIKYMDNNNINNLTLITIPLEVNYNLDDANSLN